MPRPSESFARLTDGGMAFSMEIGVMASQVPALVAEGRRLWRERWASDPVGWRDEDFVRHAITQNVQAATSASSEPSA